MNKIPISREFLSGKTFLTMKFIVIFMLTGICNAFAVSYGQNEKINIKAHNATLKEVVSMIENQSEYVFFYKSEEMANLQRFNLNEKEKTVKEILDILVQNTPLTYKISNQYIYLNKREKIIEPARQQQRNIVVKGLVLDADGNPLPGVTITVVGSTKGVITDYEGIYSIEVKPTDQLLFSFVGMESQTIQIESRTTINVVLKEKIDELEEVTIVAFGKQKKESVIGSISSIKPTELKIPSSNLTTALAGRVGGIISYQRSGEPGQDNADFFIRGVTTFGYKVDPLILIDNVEVSTIDLARLEVDDIASFSIMKDATSTALYGARGANGVILITTKHGTEGKTKVSFRIENSISTPTKNVELADPVTYMRLANEAVLTRDPLGIIPYSDQKIDQTIAGVNPIMFPVTDWRKALMNDYAMNQRINLNVSGGGKIARYYVAGSFNQENGILKVDKQNNFNSNIDLKIYTLRTNVNVNMTESTEMNVRLSGSFDDYTGPVDGGTSIYRNVMRTNPVFFPPFYPIDEEHKYTNHILFGNYENGNYLNPYADMIKGYKDYSRSNMAAQFELKQNLNFITKGLVIRGMMNTSKYSYFDVSRAYRPFYYQASSWDKQTNSYRLNILNEEEGTEYLNYNPGAKTVSSDFYLESSLNYDRIFHNNHEISSLLVFMMRNKLTGNAADLQESLPYRNVGLSGRTTYSFQNRYYVEFNFGYNGSERFYKSNRYGFFPSFGFAWNISNESFWNSNLAHIISRLKIKGTYGLVGNDAIGSSRFLYLSNVNMDDPGRAAVFGRDYGYFRNGISLSRYSDPNITWETARKTNLGLEMTLFENMEIQVDAYKEHRTNILMPRWSTPATMGLSAIPQANIGEAESKGIDFSVDYNKIINKDFWIQGRANFTYANSKNIVFEEPTYENAPWKSRIGYPIRQQWGYIAERLFVDDKEANNSPRQSFGEYGGGDIKYRDINGDGQITALDQVPIGYPTTPEIVYGFGFSIGYKQIDLSIFFQGLARESFWINVWATSPFIPYYYSDTERGSGLIYQNQLLKAYADNHWSEENRNLYALWPRLSTSSAGINNNSQQSTWFMRDGSFIRLKSIELGYTLPQKIMRKQNTNLRIYFSGTNLLTFSKFKLWDPEMAGNGLGYPIQKVFNIGMNVTF